MYNAKETALRINALLKDKKLSQKDMLEECDLLAEATLPPETSEMLQIGRVLSYDDRCETMHMMRYKKERGEK